MKEATYRVIRFALPSGDHYVATAWNYDLALMVSTRDHATYTDARKDLDLECAKRGVKLRWFDGSYVYGSHGFMAPDDKTHSV